MKKDKRKIENKEIDELFKRAVINSWEKEEDEKDPSILTISSCILLFWIIIILMLKN